MDRYNILTVLDNLIKDANFHCEWGIEWLEKQSYIDLLFQFSLPNPQRQVFTDRNEFVMDSPFLPFEFRIVLYDGSLIESKGSEYIKTIPIDYQKGICYGELVSIIKYLHRLTSKIRLQWQEFLQNRTSFFEVVWDNEEFDRIRQSLIDTNRYSHALVYYPRERQY